MRYPAAIAIAAFVAGGGLFCRLAAPEKQSTPTATQLAARLAQSVDPFLRQSGG